MILKIIYILIFYIGAFIENPVSGEDYKMLYSSNTPCPPIEEPAANTLNALFKAEGLSERRIELGLEQHSANEFTPLVNETDHSVCRELNKKSRSNPDHYLTTYYKSDDYYVIVNAIKPPVFSEDGEYIYISSGNSIVTLI